MEEKPYLAKGFYKGGQKINIKEEWNNISEHLNCIGPPFRSGEGWIKVWADFKFKLKKKLTHNKAESHATGGGTYKQFTLSPVEEAAVNLLHMHSIIEHKDAFGIKRPRVVSPDAVPNKTSNDSLEEIDQPCTSSAPVYKRKNKNQEKVTLLEQQVETQKELLLELKSKLSEIERYNRKIFKLKEEKLNLYKKELKKKDDHRKALLEIRKSELEIKAKNLELEELRVRGLSKN